MLSCRQMILKSSCSSIITVCQGFNSVQCTTHLGLLTCIKCVSISIQWQDGYKKSQHACTHEHSAYFLQIHRKSQVQKLKQHTCSFSMSLYGVKCGKYKLETMQRMARLLHTYQVYSKLSSIPCFLQFSSAQIITHTPHYPLFDAVLILLGISLFDILTIYYLAQSTDIILY